MNHWIIVACGIMMLGLGLFMVISPRNATKKELRDDEKVVSGMRKKGFIVIACGVIAIGLGIFRMTALS